MNDQIFVNEAINNGIINYINDQNSNELTCHFVRILINIYGDLDIMNPYKTKNESDMGGFDTNICKFGYSKEELTSFKKDFLELYLSKEEKPNKYYNKVSKELIDMFVMKIKSIDRSKIDFDKVKSVLLEDDFGYSTDMDEIKRYYSYKLKELELNVNYTLKDNKVLSKDAYEAVGYSYDNVKNMSNEKVDEINNEVFKYYNIDPTSEDKFLRLEQAVLYYKEFPKEIKKDENGYVNKLIIAVIVSITLLAISVLVGGIIR